MIDLFGSVSKYTHMGATISKNGRYRYRLWREWRGTHDPKNWHWLGANDGEGKPLGEPKGCLFIMLNPSTADANDDDPTIRRCVAFAKREKFERLEVVNIFAYRTPDPDTLLALSHDDDPVGWENQRHITMVGADAGLIVMAWGAHGGHLGQNETVLGWLPDDVPWRCLGRTKEGFPRHPLYVRADQKLEAFP